MTAHRLEVLQLPIGDIGQLLTSVTNLRPVTELQLDDTIRATIARVVNEYRHCKKLRAAGLRPATRVLLCGPPGCGKTTTAGAIALAVDLPLMTMRQDAVVSSYMGSTSVALRKTFEFVKSHPMVLMIDEFDSLGRARSDRDQQGAAQEGARIVNSLLVMFEEMRESDSIVIAATNMIGVLDHALWRRFDEVMLFQRPSPAESATLIMSILARHGQRPIMWRWPLHLKEVSHADVERIALDAVKAVTMDGALPVDRALRAAVDRHQERRELTAKARKK